VLGASLRRCVKGADSEPRELSLKHVGGGGWCSRCLRSSGRYDHVYFIGRHDLAFFSRKVEKSDAPGRTHALTQSEA
jgi:hypothetical protein